jgi:hypothetical protein
LKYAQTCSAAIDAVQNGILVQPREERRRAGTPSIPQFHDDARSSHSRESEQQDRLVTLYWPDYILAQQADKR